MWKYEDILLIYFLIDNFFNKRYLFSFINLIYDKFDFSSVTLDITAAAAVLYFWPSK